MKFFFCFIVAGDFIFQKASLLECKGYAYKVCIFLKKIILISFKYTVSLQCFNMLNNHQNMDGKLRYHTFLYVVKENLFLHLM